MERLVMGMHAGYLYSKDRILEAQERFEEARWTNVVEQPRFGSSARPRDTRVTRVTDCEGANPLQRNRHGLLPTRFFGQGGQPSSSVDLVA